MTTRLTLDALEVLDAIDRKGSFSAAAAALYRVPSAITYTINKLEDDLGVTLFVKDGRRSSLTPAGRRLLEQGRELLEATERLIEDVKQAESGWESRLAIAVDSIYPLERIYPLLDAFYQIQPDIEIELYEEVLGGSWEALLDGRADLVIGAAPPYPPGQELEIRPIQDIDWVFAVPPSHPLCRLDRPITTDDIKTFRAIIVRDSSHRLPPQSRRILDKQPLLRVVTMQQKINAQLKGLGIGFLPVQRISQLLDTEQLVSLPLAESPTPSQLVVAAKSPVHGRALQWFLEQSPNYFLSEPS
ncbi:MAG: LysR family transcriptional regulator [Kangiellaceae bacterium]|nr:LysR family transcriptional regulator [Kangiellaceae bacterium]|tara:strand:+ start:21333 stop:22235 length:903 start_codon:yes stop_codon:yes gene_type:complete